MNVKITSATRVLTGASVRVGPPNVFEFFGSPTTGTNFIVPAGITSLDIAMWGGGGSGSAVASPQVGAGAGFITGLLAVTPGETLEIGVAGGGVAGASSGLVGGDGGTNGGGNGGVAAGGSTQGRAGGGGGHSHIKRSATILAVAAGGGGIGYQVEAAGEGGGTTGGDADNTDALNHNGRGGTQSAGGIAGPSGIQGTAGAQLTGGNGSGSTFAGQPAAGGGGSGYFGGGGGSLLLSGQTGGGGGGSSYIAQLTSASTEAGNVATGASGGQGDPDYQAGIGVGADGTSPGTSAGNGLVIIRWTF